VGQDVADEGSGQLRAVLLIGVRVWPVDDIVEEDGQLDDV
jgi:hypothetical protein